MGSSGLPQFKTSCQELAKKLGRDGAGRLLSYVCVYLRQQIGEKPVTVTELLRFYAC